MLCCTTSDAQQILNIEEGPIIELEEKGKLLDFFNYGAEEIACVVEKENRFTGKYTYRMYVFSKNLELVATQELDLNRYKNRMQYVAMLNMGNAVYLLSSFDNLKKKKKFIFAQSFNAKTFELNNDLNMIAAFPLTDKKRNKNEKVLYEKSPDGHKIAFYLSHNVKYKSNYKIDFAVFDEKLNLIWQNKCNLSENKKERKLSRIVNSEVRYNAESHPYHLSIGNKGQVYINRDKRTQQTENKSYTYYLDTVNPKGTAIKTNAKANALASNYTIVAAKNNRWYANSYRKETSDKKQHYVSYTQWDSTQVVNKQTITLAADSFNLSNNYQIKYIDNNFGGDVISIGEFYTEKLQRAGATKNEQLYYNFNDILLSRYTPQTNEIKYHIIKKHQKGNYSALPYLSFQTISLSSGIAMIYYNENPLQSNTKVFEYAILGKDGEMSYQRMNIPNQEELENPLNINELWQVNQSSAIIYQQNKKKMKLYLIKAN